MALRHVAERTLGWEVTALCHRNTTRPSRTLLDHKIRRHATHSNASSRKQVTIASDDGRVQWSDLSVREKAARTTQQSFNLLVVLTGILACGTVGYFLFSDVFSSDSATSQYNRAADRIKKEPRCIEVLGPSRKITAFTEMSHSRFQRNRAIVGSTRLEKDMFGTEHMHMHFFVEGPLNRGKAIVHLTKAPSESQWSYSAFYVDVKGHSRIWLETTSAEQDKKKPSGKMFGVRWW